MNVKTLLLFFFITPAMALAQGFAGLGTDAKGFRLPDPEKVFSFPQDHGAHPEFRIEWWYLTANLRGEDGKDYGLQWTLFRSATDPTPARGWNSNQFWMGHAAITTPNRHFVAERFARGGIGQAGVQADPFLAWIDDWQMTGISEGRLKARGAEFSYDMRFVARGPFVAQGNQGYSVKSPGGQASHYYSQPYYDISGDLTLPEGSVSVTGQAWLDREWSSQPLSPDQTGWDWFSMHFDDGNKMMGFRLRSKSGNDYTVGTWIAPDGSATALAPGELQLTPLASSAVAGRDIPTRWALSLPSRALNITVTALNPQSWMDTLVAYWEGPVQVTGSHGGIGYLEMTGYE